MALEQIKIVAVQALARSVLEKILVLATGVDSAKLRDGVETL